MSAKTTNTLPDWVVRATQQQSEWERRILEKEKSCLQKNTQQCRNGLQMALNTQLPGWSECFDLITAFTGTYMSWEDAVSHGGERAVLCVKSFSAELLVLRQRRDLSSLFKVGCGRPLLGFFDVISGRTVWIDSNTTYDDAWQQIAILVKPLLEDELQRKDDADMAQMGH